MLLKTPEKFKCVRANAVFRLQSPRTVLWGTGGVRLGLRVASGPERANFGLEFFVCMDFIPCDKKLVSSRPLATGFRCALNHKAGKELEKRYEKELPQTMGEY